MAIRRALAALLLLPATSLAAGGATTAQQESPPPARDASVVRDFADIALGEPRIEADPSGTAVTIHVTTTIDAACSVVFGEDERFGRIGTDTDMAGGGHRDHAPMLGGLLPGTTYLYRLQGAGADGTLYQSRILSFRTPDAPAGAEAGPDLARLATVAEVSSEHSAAFAAAKAIDGDPSTEWSSRGDGDEAFITLDLGEPRAVAAVAFVTRDMADGSATTHTFTLTADSVEVGTFPAGPEPVGIDVTARVLRFDVASSSGGNTGAREIVIRGPAGGSERGGPPCGIGGSAGPGTR